MPATGSTFTQETRFGVSNGPTYTGKTTVPATATGTETYRNYSGQALHGGGCTIDGAGFTTTNLLGLGLVMAVDPVQTGAPTALQLAAATVDVVFHGVLGGGDATITLAVGQSWSIVDIPSTWVADCTSITVNGDTDVDCDVYGLVLLTA